MSRTAGAGSTGQAAHLTMLGAPASGRKVRRSPKNRVSVLAAEVPSSLDPAVPQQRKALKAIRGFGQHEPENVESLANYKPVSKTYWVSLAFSGEAGSAMSELMTKLKVDNPNEVVKPALALLLSAQGKEILLRDPETGAVEMVEV
jgi:hypothetical protein